MKRRFIDSLLVGIAASGGDCAAAVPTGSAPPLLNLVAPRARVNRQRHDIRLTAS
jgi:hypothetical protein